MVYKRVDSNQSELVKQIRKLGATVQHLHASVDLAGADDCIAAIRARREQ